jgi:CheY-like chemotaxis protein/anti-sigma regulatory factor (Ser/Thr protein kinase)
VAKDKKIELKLELNKSLQKITADRDKIYQVINNLVSNAFKFTEAEGAVTISTSFYGSDTNFIHVSVKDTGIGIDKKDFDKLFQRFQQIDSGLTRKVGGAGLGLAISKQIIDLHGGKIWVESEPGKGSIFSFILPVTYGGEKMMKKILIIDDEADLCETIKAQLETSGFNVSAALSGQEGLDKVKDYRPDLIILDLMMPVMDGFEVCKRLKKDTQTSSIPVVVLTALQQEEAAKKALSMGAEGYLVKPFEQDSLLFTIREFLK